MNLMTRFFFCANESIVTWTGWEPQAVQGFTIHVLPMREERKTYPRKGYRTWISYVGDCFGRYDSLFLCHPLLQT